MTDLHANLADNTTVETAVHAARIYWMGEDREVAVLCLEGRPLLGTALLQGFRLLIDFSEDGSLLIDTIPTPRE